MEIWENIENTNGYQVSTAGQIRRIRNGVEEILKPKINDGGYKSYSIPRACTPLVARLVGLAFIPNPDNKPEINHIDTNKQNNNVTNLEWSTKLENMKHAIDCGLIVRGEKHKSSKLNNISVKKIRRLFATGKYTKLGLSKQFNTHRSNIQDIISGKTWSHL